MVQQTGENKVPFMGNIIEGMNEHWAFQAAFHSDQIRRIKRNLGKGCTYLSHERAGDKRFIKAILVNSFGGKDIVSIEIDADLSSVKRPEYDNIQQTLGERLYDGSTKTV